MEDFRQLKIDDQSILVHYLQKNELECPDMVHRFQMNGIEKQSGNRKSGTFYGYFEEQVLKGVFFFANNHVFMCHYESDRILERVVLLKAIRHYRPKLLIGPEEFISPIWEMIRKTVAQCNFYESYFMTCQKLETLQSSCESMVKDTSCFDEHQVVAFWMEVEKAFGRQVTMVQNLKEKLMRQTVELQNVYIEEDGRIVAQGLIEFSTERYAQLGGIYVNPAYRRKGYAQDVVTCLSHQVLEKGRIPVLVVEKKNKAAVALYEKLGYKARYKHITLEITYQ